MHQTPQATHLAKIIWDYMHMQHELAPADCMLVLGNHELRCAQHAAHVFHRDLVPFAIVSGNRGAGTDTLLKDNETEADVFTRIMEKHGVPPEKMIKEDRATNTGQNIQLTYELLAERGVTVNKMILVTKPYMERRVYATFMKQWPGDGNVEIMVTSPEIPFDEYFTSEEHFARQVNFMVGDVDRIKHYPAQGFQIHQDIPDEVWDARTQMVEMGFNERVLE